MNFSKKGVAKKQKMLVSKLPRNKRKLSISAFKTILVLFLAIIIACIGAGFGMLKGILDDAPPINPEALIPQGYQTTIYDQDGHVLTVLANFDSNREYVYFQDIPTDVVNAFIAIEDQRFWEHKGIDVHGIFRAFVQGLQSGGFDQGASTLTQQLIKNQIFNVGLNESTFLDRFERKVQEQYLAIEIEKKLDKENIVEYYLNTIYLSQGRYGVETAAEYYFGKKLDQLSISECAVLAAIPKNPSAFDPILYPEDNAERRLLVLNKMLDLGYITQAQYDIALTDDVYTRIADRETSRNNSKTKVNSYYIDEVINQLEDDFMAMGYTKAEADYMIYSGGLDVKICLDENIQAICDEVLNDPNNYPAERFLLNYALTLVDKDGETHNYSENMMETWFHEEKGQTGFNRIFSDPDAARAAADEYKAAMIDETGYKELAESYNLVVQPQISFTLIDQETGQVKAIVGGRGEKKENRSLNRASESTRQPGSTFKVLAAFLPGIDGCGMGLGTTYVDEPYVYENGTPLRNWYGEAYRGPQSIRQAIVSSLNIIAVKTITDVTPQLAYEYLLKLGFTTLVERRTTSSGKIESDINQSLALGGLTDGITNLEITAAYAAIANEGNYIKPIFYTEVYDHDGNLIIDNRKPEETQVISPQAAWLLTDAMHSCATYGTGSSANPWNGIYVAGKTGTTSSNFDYWFCGYTPYYTASIWIGYDRNINFSNSDYHKAMWRKIMAAICELEEQDTSKTFERPDGIVSATVCADTGLLPVSGQCSRTISELYVAGTVPTKYCEGVKEIEICNESHLKATEFCPETTKYTFVIDDNGKITINGADFGYGQDIFEKTCDLHTEETTTTEEEEKTTQDPNVKRYSITSVTSGVGGSITQSKTVNAGESATFYITVDKGYEISDVSVDGKSVGAVTEYKFKNVGQNHTIYVVFKKKSTDPPTTEAPTTQAPTEAPTTQAPATEAPPTEAPPDSPANSTN